ncbi:pyridoxamine 5'-phosphate oxidase [Dactylosporangium matsuzakiense]|nr:pyridoxamine 5'-phosphate oxidase [Dactylosporangium matsuzakiense]UWZ45066.1 pyridoxamine 5'-phosphate oxidase [Dactylosporangium matsuzakiense]
MATWGDFATADAALAAAIRTLLHQYGPGLAYLATIRPDGGPRLHPVSPVLTSTGLYCFVLPSPKRQDLDRDGRYALHSYPAEDNDDEAYLAGRALPVTDPSTLTHLTLLTRAAQGVDWKAYELTIDVAMHVHHDTPTTSTTTVWKPHARPAPRPRENGPCTKAVDSVQ